MSKLLRSIQFPGNPETYVPYKNEEFTIENTENSEVFTFMNDPEKDCIDPKILLGVKSQIVPKQEGSGDPSPTNVRPIVATDKVKLTRCGKNMCFDADIVNQDTKYRDLVTVPSICMPVGAEVTVSFETENTGLECYINPSCGLDEVKFVMDGKRKTFSGVVKSHSNFPTPDKVRVRLITRFSDTSSVLSGLISNIQIEAGAVSTAFQNFSGETYTAQLPPDTYGGEVDWEKGELKNDYKYFKFDGTEEWREYDVAPSVVNHLCYIIKKADSIKDSTKNGDEVICSIAPTMSPERAYTTDSPSVICFKSGELALTMPKTIAPNLSSFKDYLAQKKSENDPIQVLLLTNQAPTPIILSANPTALPGVNTLYSDTGPVTSISSIRGEISKSTKKFVETNYPHLPLSKGGTPILGTPGDIAVSDGAGGITWSSDSKMSWGDVKGFVQIGLGPKMFPVGYEFTTHDSVNNQDIIWRVDAHDHHKSAENPFGHTMTLHMKHVLSNSGGSQIGVQCDAPEALYYAEEELPAGTYNYTVQDQPWFAGDKGKTFQFTLAQPVPKGGQVVVECPYNQTMVGKNVKTYATVGGTEAIETVVVSEGSAGIAWGNTDGTKINHIHRILLGNNNAAQSAMRQFLNSDKDRNTYWKPQCIYDRAPSWMSSLDGFMKGLDPEFVNVVSPAILECRSNNYFESKDLSGNSIPVNSTYTMQDKFFLLSRPEVFGDYDDSKVKDGTVLEYYEGLSNAQRIIRDVAGTARYAWLRSPYPWLTNHVRFVRADGSVNIINASNSLGVAAACIIA